MSSIHEAAKDGDLARVQQLLDEGADKEAKNVRTRRTASSRDTPEQYGRGFVCVRVASCVCACVGCRMTAGRRSCVRR